MTDHAARMESLLARRPEVARIEQPAEALIKRDELLVLDRHAEAVHDAARRWVDGREDFADVGVARLRLRSGAGIDAAALVHELRGGAGAHRRTSVTPNHVLRGEPDYTGGPFGVPQPTADAQAPIAAAGGRRVTIGVLDTGIDPHPWFAKTDWYARCTEDEREVLHLTHDWELESEAGHGTFIAGLIMRQAPSAFLRIERVLADDGICDELELLQGLARIRRRTSADADRLDILNLSLGCFTFDDRPSPVLADAVARLSRGTVVVAAAGNNSGDRPFWPAALKDTVAVAALAAHDGADGPQRAGFSNYGWWVDACAPGENVSSSFITHGRENGEDFHGFARWSGTSFAAPYVAGSIAALMSDKDMTARDAVSALLDPSAGTRLPDLGVVVGAATAGS